MKQEQQTRAIGINFRLDDLEKIDCAAQQMRLTRTAFVNIASLSLVKRINGNPEDAFDLFERKKVTSND